MTIGKINNIDTIVDKIMNSSPTHFFELSGGEINATEAVAALINQKENLIEGPLIEADKQEGARSAGKVLMATVKGDVHDIGKNIVSVVMACNNYEIIDLGVMVPAEMIVRKAIEEKVDIIGLSGLITPSLEEMAHVAVELKRAGLDIPIMIGGATTSKLHTALKIAPVYGGPVIHMKDASQNALVAARLLNPESSSEFVERLNKEYEELRLKNSTKQVKTVSLEEAQKNKLNLWS